MRLKVRLASSGDALVPFQLKPRRVKSCAIKTGEQQKAIQKVACVNTSQHAQRCVLQRPLGALSESSSRAVSSSLLDVVCLGTTANSSGLSDDDSVSSMISISDDDDCGMANSNSSPFCTPPGGTVTVTACPATSTSNVYPSRSVAGAITRMVLLLCAVPSEERRDRRTGRFWKLVMITVYLVAFLFAISFEKEE